MRNWECRQWSISSARIPNSEFQIPNSVGRIMPIHDQGYRRYGGSKAAVGQGWMVIARAGIRAMFAKRAFLGLLLVAWVPFLIRAVQFYARANLPQAQMLAPTPENFPPVLAQHET